MSKLLANGIAIMLPLSTRTIVCVMAKLPNTMRVCLQSCRTTASIAEIDLAAGVGIEAGNHPGT